MSSKYRTQFEIPFGFPDVLADLSREILRHQPSNIYTFAANYFSGKLSTSEGSETVTHPNEKFGDTSQKAAVGFNPEAFIDELSDLIDDEKVRGTDSIEALSLKKVLNTLSARFGLSTNDMLLFYGEAHQDASGRVDKFKFLQDARTVSIVLMDIREKANAVSKMIDEHGGDERLLLHGMSKFELCSMLVDLLTLYDEAKDKKVAPEHISEALMSMDLGLTVQESNALLLYFSSEPDVDQRLDYSAFFNQEDVWAVLRRLFEFNASSLEERLDPLKVQTLLDDTFISRDTESSYKLPVDDVREMLHQVRLGLSRIQISALLSFEDVTPTEGTINYANLSERAATLIPEMLSWRGALSGNLEDDSISDPAAHQFFATLDSVLPDRDDGSRFTMSAEELYEHIEVLVVSANLSARERAALRVAVPRVVDNTNASAAVSSEGVQQSLFHVEEFKAVSWPIVRHLRVCASVYGMLDDEGMEENHEYEGDAN